jgi:hypothetical protein
MREFDTFVDRMMAGKAVCMSCQNVRSDTEIMMNKGKCTQCAQGVTVNDTTVKLEDEYDLQRLSECRVLVQTYLRTAQEIIHNKPLTDKTALREVGSILDRARILCAVVEQVLGG